MVRRRSRRMGYGGDSVPPWLALGPEWSYLADSTYLILATGVERWADELDPGTAAKDLVQLTGAAQPGFGASSAPSGANAVTFDGSTQFMSTSRLLGMGAGPYTGYEAIVRQSVGGGSVVAEQDSTVAATFARHRYVTTGDGNQRFASGTSEQTAGVVRAVGDAYWVETTFDPTSNTLSMQTTGGSLASGAATGALTADSSAIGARIASGAASQFGAHDMLWWFGYARILTASERAIAQAAAAARLGV